MSWPSNELDRYKAALERIVEISEDAASIDEDFMQVFKIADEALNPKSAEPDDGW